MDTLEFPLEQSTVLLILMTTANLSPETEEGLGYEDHDDGGEESKEDGDENATILISQNLVLPASKLVTHVGANGSSLHGSLLGHGGRLSGGSKEHLGNRLVGITEDGNLSANNGILAVKGTNLDDAMLELAAHVHLVDIDLLLSLAEFTFAVLVHVHGLASGVLDLGLLAHLDTEGLHDHVQLAVGLGLDSAITKGNDILNTDAHTLGDAAELTALLLANVLLAITVAGNGLVAVEGRMGALCGAKSGLLHLILDQHVGTITVAHDGLVAFEGRELAALLHGIGLLHTLPLLLAHLGNAHLVLPIAVAHRLALDQAEDLVVTTAVRGLGRHHDHAAISVAGGRSTFDPRMMLSVPVTMVRVMRAVGMVRVVVMVTAMTMLVMATMVVMMTTVRMVMAVAMVMLIAILMAHAHRTFSHVPSVRCRLLQSLAHLLLKTSQLPISVARAHSLSFSKGNHTANNKLS